MNTSDINNPLPILLKKIKNLQEIVDASAPSFSTEPPAGYTAARWQLALQSFNERLPLLKTRNFLRNTENSAITQKPETETEIEIEFGPEWDLNCAKKELENLLNKPT